jgi:NAD(P)H-quinone oxidoreductase subunit 4L
LIELAHFQVLSAALFAIGLYGVLARRSAVLILMSIELMLNAVNINLIGFAAFGDFEEPQRTLGQVIVIFVITIAAAELALAIAIILRLYRNRSSVNVDEIDLMKW